MFQMVKNEKNEPLGIGDYVWFVDEYLDILYGRIGSISEKPWTVHIYAHYDDPNVTPYFNCSVLVEDFGDDISKGPHLFSTKEALLKLSPWKNGTLKV